MLLIRQYIDAAYNNKLSNLCLRNKLGTDISISGETVAVWSSAREVWVRFFFEACRKRFFLWCMWLENEYYCVEN